MKGASFEVNVGRRRRIFIPRAAAEAVGISEGMRVRIIVDDGRLIIEPLRDAIWYALHDPKIGYVGFEELEEESMRVQERIKNPG
ncbi:MAG: AbrB/MazE/SpoVT family DNA-binding domain-containing protein [Sulfolobales archaeon]